MHHSSSPPSRFSLAFLNRRAVLATVALAVLGAAAGYLGAGYITAERSATATILLNPLEGNAYRPGGSGEDLVNLTTEVQVVRSDEMNSRVADELTWADDPTALASALEVSVQTNTQILSLTFTDADPARAQEGAQAYADAYLSYREERARASIEQDREVISGQVADLQDDLDQLASQIADAGTDSPEATLLNARVQTLTTQISQLTAQLADLSATTLDPGQVVVYSTLSPPSPFTKPIVLAVAGGVLGAGLGLASAFLLSRRSRLVRGPADVRLVHETPIAGLKSGLDVAGHGDAPGGAELTPWEDGAPAELLEARHAVLSALAARARRTVLVAAARPGITRTSVALARAMGGTGVRVAVIDTTAGLTPPSGDLAGITTFEDLLADPAREIVLAKNADGVSMLPAGSLPDPAALALRGSAIEEVLHRLLDRFDVLVLHAERVDTDLGRALAAVAQHVVIEAHVGMTRTTDLLTATQASGASGATVVGVILVETQAGGNRWPWPGGNRGPAAHGRTEPDAARPSRAARRSGPAWFETDPGEPWTVLETDEPVARPDAVTKAGTEPVTKAGTEPATEPTEPTTDELTAEEQAPEGRPAVDEPATSAPSGDQDLDEHLDEDLGDQDLFEAADAAATRRTSAE